jgi:hypothetical protein
VKKLTPVLNQTEFGLPRDLSKQDKVAYLENLEGQFKEAEK